jgi:hypothetical protein
MNKNLKMCIIFTYYGHEVLYAEIFLERTSVAYKTLQRGNQFYFTAVIHVPTSYIVKSGEKKFGYYMKKTRLKWWQTRDKTCKKCITISRSPNVIEE